MRIDIIMAKISPVAQSSARLYNRSDAYSLRTRDAIWGDSPMNSEELAQISFALDPAKSAARIYRRLMGKPLGIMEEIAEFEAARILGFELSYVKHAANHTPNGGAE